RLRCHAVSRDFQLSFFFRRQIFDVSDITAFTVNYFVINPSTGDISIYTKAGRVQLSSCATAEKFGLVPPGNLGFNLCVVLPKFSLLAHTIAPVNSNHDAGRRRPWLCGVPRT
ncbi:hypothetical protein TWF102_010338, partial [Orbilia oligospora]